MIYSVFSVIFLLFLSVVTAADLSDHSSHRKIPRAVSAFIEEKSLKADHHFAAASVPPTGAIPKNLSPTAASLVSAIVSQQQLKDTTYIPLIRNEEKAGIWPSFIHLNLYGIWPLPDIRRGVGFLDNNAFNAEWILELLIEADELQPLDNTPFQTAKYSDFSSFLKYSIQALFPDFVNKNAGHYFPGAGFDSAFLFWEQTKNVNGSMVTYPTNFAVPLQVVLGDGNSAPNPLLEWLANIIGVTVNDMSIPADFDDTSASIQVYLYMKAAAKKNPAKYGAALEAMNQAFFSSPSADDGVDVLAKKVFTLLDRYAYKPYSTNKDANTIDPRTYFWMRPLIHSSPANASFITTWLESRGENFRLPLYGPNMPGLINDVDGGVIANAFFMLLSIVPQITDRQLLSADIINLLESTESLIVYLIDSRMYDTRADLVLKYYPSVIQFLYFVSRSVRFINSSPVFPHSALSNLGKRVQRSMQSAGIEFLLKKMKSNGGCKDSLPNKKSKNNADVNCFDEFIGNADRNIFNIPTPNYEDRIATTALAANAMIDIYTTIDASSDASASLSWIPNTPAAVKAAVNGCINFLKQAITVSNRPLENAFFSGFAKDETDFTYFYPFNSVTYRNGTAVPADAKAPTKVSEYSIGVSGVIDESAYAQLIKNKPFGHEVPQGVWLGNNVNATRLVYWSSPSVSLAVTNLALAKAEKLTF